MFSVAGMTIMQRSATRISASVVVRLSFLPKIGSLKIGKKRRSTSQKKK